ncbi:MAG: hybrid sensor histidine kinase/response regulator [Pseudobdellovibrionaceae bacterium]
MDSALSEYISECREILQRVNNILAELEKGALGDQRIDALYRDFHTLKGTAQLFGFQEIGQIAHILEASFGPIRKFKTPVRPVLIDQIYKSLDLIDRMVKSIADGGKDLSSFKVELHILLPNVIEAAARQFNRDHVISNELIQPLVIPQRNSLVLGEENSAPESPEDPKFSVSKPKPVFNLEQEERKMTSATSKAETTGADTTVRVQVEVLDRLMNLAGELVLLRNQVLQYSNKSEDSELMGLSKSLDLVTSDLQNEVMKTRMQPIGNILSKFQRVVRDLSRDLGKQIDLTIQGAETELDKTLLEAIKDPLTHIIRNACDHGIETVEERKAAGKPVNGHVLIRSYYEGGQVIVEVSDDGKGLNRAKLIAKAIEKSLVTAERAEKFSEREAFALIFYPGFSTANQVTAVSGRGVGMDVVKTNIEKIGGSVELSSRLGKGSMIQLKIPLTLAIVPALIVQSEGDRYAIPQVKLVELVRVSEEDGRKIEFVQGKPTFRLRGDLLPLVHMREVLNLEGKAESFNAVSAVNIVVLNAEGEKFGLIVDEILDTTDIVVKPLAQFLRRVSIFSGATIMGDGAIGLILDVVGIAEKSHVSVRSAKKQGTFDELQNSKGKHKMADAQEFLLVKTSAAGIHAIPLCLVHRLEEFARESIEVSGDQKVVRYRNSILPLLNVDQALKYAVKESENPDSTVAPVVVVQKSGRNYGLMVREILDVILIEGQVDDTIQDREGILGNLIYEEKILVVMDVLALIETEFSLKFAAVSGGQENSSRIASDRVQELQRISKNMRAEKTKVLFAEDVVFFRKQVMKVLSRAGYEVVTAENGALALKILTESPEEFAVILSDIEMPEMNGLEFARAVKANPKTNSIPLVALTTRFKENDIKEGQEAGFDIYLEKLNEEKLLSGLNDVLRERHK